MARPIIMRIRVTELERIRIHYLAQREGINASEFIRQAVREAADLRGMPPLGITEFYEKIRDQKEVQNGS